MRRRLRVYAYMIDDCESIILLRQRVQGEKLIRSGWGLPKENLSRNGENSSLFLHRIAYYVIGVQANYALAHSTLTIVLTEKKEKKKRKNILGISITRLLF